MSASIHTILIIGGTSGIGEAFARRFHQQGKKVIITGRREARLTQIKSELSGLQTYVMDNADLASLPKHVDTLFARYPDIDTVWVNSGIMSASSPKDINNTTDEQIADEVTTNVTAPFVLARNIIPRLLARGPEQESTFMITSSGLAFVPVPAFPIYNATKAAVHQYLVSVRQALQGTNVHIIEIVPPLVETGFGDAFRHLIGGLRGMDLEDYTNETFQTLDSQPAKDLKEVAAGSAVGRVNAWRSSIGEMLKSSGLGG